MNHTSIDLGHIARELNLPTESVERTIALLDEGNTVPFITRYRKDQTKGLDEEQIREIQLRVGKLRLLHERKQTILKSIEAQGKLTPELAELIQSAHTTKRLEDLYLPFKPKKQTLATLARQRGLEPLAREILDADPAAADLNQRAADYVSAEREVNSVSEALVGVGHLLAERFGENAELRGRLRRIFQRSGKLVCTKVEPPAEAAPTMPAVHSEGTPANSETPATTDTAQASAPDVVTTPFSAPSDGLVTTVEVPDSVLGTPNPTVPPPAEALAGGADQGPEPGTLNPEAPAHDNLPNTSAPNTVETAAVEAATEQAATAQAAETTAEQPAGEPKADQTVTEQARSGEVLPTGRLFEKPAVPVAVPEPKKKKKKKKKKVASEHAFKDFYDFQEPLGKVPPHRVLAINRGERARAIRVRIEADFDAMQQEADQLLVPAGHPHAEFLRNCVRDALTRLIVPSLEREIRREMTDRAEEHAVDVFVRNLRKLLLQQPVRKRRVLAVDPGFKSGCKMVALDEFGNVLGHSVIYVIGKGDRRDKAKSRLADMVKQYQCSVIAIGNGTGCRETEQLVAEVLSDELKGQDVAYVTVNEAGASIYSTSPLGREELPQYDALQRGAISIGRRLLDPLSEMVKINPANLGVGLYQHDMKAKHLKESLDAVVESCVNFVGVDVNSASPALLRYVSGMNALTARRIYEYRREHGPFKNREELRQVPGVGEATFVQAAGFLKVIGGENPLDATWIHPESYEIAQRVLALIGSDVSELAKTVPAPPPKPEVTPFGVLPEEPAAEAAQAAEAEPVTLASPAADEQSPVGSPQSEGLVTTAETLTPGESGDSSAAIPPPAESLAGGGEQGSEPGTVLVDTSAEGVPVDTSAPQAVPTEDVQQTTAAQTSQQSSQPPSSQESSSQLGTAPAATAPDAPSKNALAEKVAQADVERLAGELNVGTLLLRDILNSLRRPGIDPRDSLHPPVFRRGIMKLEDLQPGMELQGTVLNVVDFGVFVDIGLSDSGLVHISRLADRYIRDPHEVVGVGDVLKVWVVDVDRTRRRVSLTAIAPGTERPQRPPREPRQGGGQRPPRPQQAGAPQGGQGEARTGERPPRGDRGHGQRGGRRDQGRNQGQQRPPRSKTFERPPSKPKPAKPLSKAMEEGQEPMRSFSDLLQFYDKKKQKPGDSGKGDAKS